MLFPCGGLPRLDLADPSAQCIISILQPVSLCFLLFPGAPVGCEAIDVGKPSEVLIEALRRPVEEEGYGRSAEHGGKRSGQRWSTFSTRPVLCKSSSRGRFPVSHVFLEFPVLVRSSRTIPYTGPHSPVGSSVTSTTLMDLSRTWVPVGGK